jgi:hypothetical protein
MYCIQINPELLFLTLSIFIKTIALWKMVPFPSSGEQDVEKYRLCWAPNQSSFITII